MKIKLKKLIIIVCLFCFLIMPANAVSVKVPKDMTTILITLNEPITSKTTEAGEVLPVDAKMGEFLTAEEIDEESYKYAKEHPEMAKLLEYAMEHPELTDDFK